MSGEATIPAPRFWGNTSHARHLPRPRRDRKCGAPHPGSILPRREIQYPTVDMSFPLTAGLIVCAPSSARSVEQRAALPQRSYSKPRSSDKSASAFAKSCVPPAHERPTVRWGPLPNCAPKLELQIEKVRACTPLRTRVSDIAAALRSAVRPRPGMCRARASRLQNPITIPRQRDRL